MRKPLFTFIVFYLILLNTCIYAEYCDISDSIKGDVNAYLSMLLNRYQEKAQSGAIIIVKLNADEFLYQICDDTNRINTFIAYFIAELFPGRKPDPEITKFIKRNDIPIDTTGIYIIWKVDYYWFVSKIVNN